MSVNGYAHPDVLVETEWLADHQHDPTLRLVEVDADVRAYQQGHIPNAVGWNWRADMQDPLRRNILTPQSFTSLLSRSGISNNSTVVLYGDKSNWFAAYAFWLLKYYGHPDVRLLNGGRKKWLAEGRPVAAEPFWPAPASYHISQTNTNVRILRDQVLHRLNQPATGLVDVRSAQEFSGELLAPDHLPYEAAMRGGHLPGAVNISWGQTVRDDGTFKSAATLHAIYSEKNITADKNVIVYCRIGERSAHTWFVLKYLLGYPNVCNYDGSWAEWGNLIDAPIER
jgi:thiosulfate/3-mercaptopyruvate sulfurtransferase